MRAAALALLLAASGLAGCAAPPSDDEVDGSMTGAAAELRISSCAAFSAGFPLPLGSFEGMLSPGFEPVRRPNDAIPVEAPVETLNLGGWACTLDDDRADPGMKVGMVWWHVSVVPPPEWARADASVTVATLGVIAEGPPLVGTLASWGIPVSTQGVVDVEVAAGTPAFRQGSLTATDPRASLRFESSVAGPTRALGEDALSWRVVVIAPDAAGRPAVAAAMDWEEGPGPAIAGPASGLISLTAEGEGWPFPTEMRTATGGQFWDLALKLAPAFPNEVQP